uniref:Uncharacterized protein n=1 Tax=Vespula pensylvanica TaxID=30213 RepID=A0A834NQL9_VESPE|nr:hypothetical protein H0235_012142 [Vespula pensylvanica]
MNNSRLVLVQFCRLRRNDVEILSPLSKSERAEPVFDAVRHSVTRKLTVACLDAVSRSQTLHSGQITILVSLTSKLLKNCTDFKKKNGGIVSSE